MSSGIYYGNIEEDTLYNTNYRKVVYTGKIQLVLMSLEPGEDIPEEVHHDHDQFIRVELGYADVVIEDDVYPMATDQAIIIPAGARHRVVNTGEGVLKLYSIYGPAEHKRNRVDVVQP